MIEGIQKFQVERFILRDMQIEHSYHTDKVKFYQLLTFKDDIDLNKKLNSENSFVTFMEHMDPWKVK